MPLTRPAEQGFRPSTPESIEAPAKKVHMISQKIEAPAETPQEEPVPEEPVILTQEEKQQFEDTLDELESLLKKLQKKNLKALEKLGMSEQDLVDSIQKRIAEGSEQTPSEKAGPSGESTGPDE